MTASMTMMVLMGTVMELVAVQRQVAMAGMATTTMVAISTQRLRLGCDQLTPALALALALALVWAVAAGRHRQGLASSAETELALGRAYRCKWWPLHRPCWKQSACGLREDEARRFSSDHC